MYIKTRDFDISKYEGLIFDARRKGDEGFPDSFFIELKSKGSVLRKYSARGFLREWTPVDFKFNAQKPTLINEVVFVFTNERVGESKKGVLGIQEFYADSEKGPGACRSGYTRKRYRYRESARDSINTSFGAFCGAFQSNIRARDV